jgi:hypothetical protein
MLLSRRPARFALSIALTLAAACAESQSPVGPEDGGSPTSLQRARAARPVAPADTTVESDVVKTESGYQLASGKSGKK